MALKHIVRHGVLAKVETVLGTPVALAAATDGVLVIESPNVQLDYTFDGALEGKAPGTAARLQRVGREGESISTTLATHARGFGAAYSATNLPSIHTLMRLMGFDATVDATADSEMVTYAPADEESFVGCSMEVYARKQKYALAGVLGDTLKVMGEFGKVPRWDFAVKGLTTARPTDVAVPAIVYPVTTEPAKAVQSNLTITSGGTTFAPVRVKQFELDINRGLTARAFDQVSGRHGGFFIGPTRTITLKLLIEMTNLTTAAPFVGTQTINPYELAARGSLCEIEFNVGSTQYKRWRLEALQAQLAETPYQEEGAVSHWNLSFDLMPSGFTQNDELAVVFD